MDTVFSSKFRTVTKGEQHRGCLCLEPYVSDVSDVSEVSDMSDVSDVKGVMCVVSDVKGEM